MFLTLNAMGDMYILLGELIIGGSTGALGYIIMANGDYQVQQATYAIIVFILIGLIIGAAFMSLFGHVSDAIVVVYILDTEI